MRFVSFTGEITKKNSIDMIHAVLSNSLNPPYPSSSPPPQPQLPIPSPPPREREDNNREGWLSRGITWRKEERGMTGFIISRELIAPRLFIPSAHSACSSRLSAASFQRGCGQDTMRRNPRRPTSRRNFPDRRHDLAPSPAIIDRLSCRCSHELIVAREVGR